MRRRSYRWLACMMAAALTLSSGAAAPLAVYAVSEEAEAEIGGGETEAPSEDPGDVPAPVPAEDPGEEDPSDAGEVSEPAPAPSSESTVTESDNTDPAEDPGTVSEPDSGYASDDDGESGSEAQTVQQTPITVPVVTPAPSVDPNLVPAVAEAGASLSLRELLQSAYGYGVVADTISFASDEESGRLTQYMNFAAYNVEGSAVLESPSGEAAASLAAVFSDDTVLEADLPEGSSFRLTEAGSLCVVPAEDGAELPGIILSDAELALTMDELEGDVQSASQKLLDRAGASGGAVLTQAGAADADTAAARTAALGEAAGAASVTPELVVDTTALPEDAAVYFNIDAVLSRIAAGELVIRKRESQVLVFTSMASSVSIGRYTVTSGGSSGSSAYSAENRGLAANLSSTVIWNLPNAFDVKLAKTAGIFLVPNWGADVRLVNDSQLGGGGASTALDAELARANTTTGRVLTGGTLYADNTFRAPIDTVSVEPEEGALVVALGGVLPAAAPEAAEETDTETKDLPEEEPAAAELSLSEEAEELSNPEETEEAESGETSSAAESTAEPVISEEGDELPDAGADSSAEEAEPENPAGAGEAEPGEKPEAVSLTFRVEKSLTVDKVPDKTQTYSFTMDLYDEGTEAEQPAAYKAEVSIAAEDFAEEQLKAVKTADFAPAVTYEEAGVWTYVIRETAGSDEATTYDDKVYVVTVTVASEDGKLVPSAVFSSTENEKSGEPAALKIEEDGTVAPLRFDNVRAVKSVTVNLKAYKTLTYTQYVSQDKKTQVSMGPVKNADFELMLTDEAAGEGEDGAVRSIPVTFDYKKIPKVKTNEKSRSIGQTVAIPALTFTAAGTYTYTLAEKDGGQKGYTYDTRSYKLVIETEEKDSVISVKSVKADGKEIWDAKTGTNTAKSLRFDNKYLPEKATLRFKVEKKVIGAADTDDTFAFELRRKPTAQGRQGTLVATAAVKGSGEGTFTKTSGSGEEASVFTYAYPSSSAYTYIATEVDKYVGYAADDTIWTCEVRVKDAGGWLEPTVVWTGDGASHSGADFVPVFTNEWKTGTFGFSKVDRDEVSRGLGGASFEVYRITSRDKTSEDYKKAVDQLKGGKVSYELLTRVAAVKSDSDGRVAVSGLLASTYYVIKEAAAPTGYHLSANPIILRTELKENSDAVAVTITSSGNMTIGKSGSSLRWYDHKVAVRIDKVNTDGKLIKGAKMQLLDESGNILEKWSSGRTKGHAVKAALRVGATYTIHEVQAPEGFEIAQDVSFTVEARAAGGYSDSALQVVTMTDPGKGTGVDAVTGGGSGNGNGEDGGVTNADGSKTKTGDTSPILLWVIVMAAAAAVLAGLGIRAARKKKKNEQ